MKIGEPGVYELSDEEYQADPCEEISLRSTVAWKLVEKGGTPAAAAYQVPRLNPEYVREQKRCFDIGTACHALLFGKGKLIEPIKGYDYSTNEPAGGLKRDEKKELRDAAYDAGRIPLLIPEQKQVRGMVSAAQRQIQALVEAGTIPDSPFNPRESEQVIVARLNGVLCRVMMDGFSLQHDILSEYKTEGQSAAKDNWMWKARKLGYVFRLAFYRRCLESLGLAFSPSVHVYVQETFPPYLLALYRVDDEFMAQEDQRVSTALKIWRWCIETNRWPGYSTAGFDLDLTDKERQQEAAERPHTQHVASEEIPDDAYQPVSAMITKKKP